MRKALLAAAVLTGFAAQGALAQVTGNPTYLPPMGMFDKREFGVHVSFPGGSDAAVEGLFGLTTGDLDVLFQGGFSFGSGTSNSTLVLVGTEFRYKFINHTDDFPADGALVAGIGARLGDFNQAVIPVGLSLGRRLNVEDSDVSIVPFLQPTLVIVAGDTDDVGFAMGLGADFRLTRSFDLRVSAGLGEIDGVTFSAIWLR
jgi:hypothetical protein